MSHQNAIIEPIQHAVLQWANTYENPQPLTQLHQIVTSDFIINILQTIPNFKFINPYLIENQNQLHFHQRVAKIKNLIKSLTRYCLTKLLKDFSEIIKINIVELALGNREEIMKLILILLGILIHFQHLKHDFQVKKIQQLSSESKKMLFIMVEQASIIFNQIQQENKRNSPNKILIKFQKLEEEVQSLEEQKYVLNQMIHHQSDEIEILKKENQTLKQQQQIYQAKIQQINMEIQTWNQKYKQKLKEIDIIEKHLQEQKQLFKGEIQKIKTQRKHQRQELFHLKKKLEMSSNLQEIILEMKDQIQRLKEENALQNQEITKLLKKAETEKQNMLDLTQRYQKLKHTNQNKEINDILSDYYKETSLNQNENLMEVQNLSSKYRMKDSLSILNKQNNKNSHNISNTFDYEHWNNVESNHSKNNNSNIFKSKPDQSNFNTMEDSFCNNFKNIHLSSLRNISITDKESTKIQNFICMNPTKIHMKIETQIEEKHAQGQEKHSFLENVKQEESFELDLQEEQSNKIVQIEKKYEMQLDLLLRMLEKYESDNKRLKKQLQLYEGKADFTKKRQESFKTKVNQMFK